MTDLQLGDDGQLRCAWGASTPDYSVYHDHEWGRPVNDERTLFEKLCLEGFQSGLSWLTILRKRPAFREVFANFDPVSVAVFEESDVLRLLDDARIVRHRGKIEASINNAKATMDLHATGTTLAELFWAHRPRDGRTPTSLAELPASTEQSTALAKELKRRGFRFVGPTTVYAAMQAMGVVNDHLQGCWVRTECETERAGLISPSSR